MPGSRQTFTRHCYTNYHVVNGAVDLTYTAETSMRACLASCAKYNANLTAGTIGCIGVSWVYAGVQATECWLKGAWGARESNRECQTGILVGREPI